MFWFLLGWGQWTRLAVAPGDGSERPTRTSCRRRFACNSHILVHWLDALAVAKGSLAYIAGFEAQYGPCCSFPRKRVTTAAGCRASLLSRVTARAAWSVGRQPGLVLYPHPVLRLLSGALEQSSIWAVESTWSSCLPFGKTVNSCRYSASHAASFGRCQSHSRSSRSARACA